MPAESRGGTTTPTGSSAKLPPDKTTTISTSSKHKTSNRSNISPASSLTSAPSPIPTTHKRKLALSQKKSSPGLCDLLEARGVGESATAIADSCESLICAESDVSGVLSSDIDLPFSSEALNLEVFPSGSCPPDKSQNCR